MRKPPFVTAVSEAKVADVGASAAEQLLDQTLVLLPTEFGRTPRTNDNDGRDHRNEAFMCLLAGAGMKRGMYSDNIEGTSRHVAILE